MWFLCCRIWYGATVVCCTCSWVLHLCCTTLATGPKRILPPRDAYGIECPRGKACQWLILTKSVHSLEPWGATERKRTFSNNSNNFFLILCSNMFQSNEISASVTFKKWSAKNWQGASPGRYQGVTNVQRVETCQPMENTLRQLGVTTNN